jgi:hypothetical protein
MYGLAAAAAVVWGGYTVFAVRAARRDPALGLRVFCDRVLAWERTTGRRVSVVGPVSEADQALLIYLRRTRTIPLETAGDLWAHGASALVLPEARLEALAGVGGAAAVVVRQERCARQGQAYALVAGEAAEEGQSINKETL